MRKMTWAILLLTSLIFGGVSISAAQLKTQASQMGPCNAPCSSDADCAFSPRCPNCLSTTGLCGNAP